VRDAQSRDDMDAELHAMEDLKKFSDDEEAALVSAKQRAAEEAHHWSIATDFANEEATSRIIAKDNTNEALRLLKRAARVDSQNGDVRRCAAQVMLALAPLCGDADFVQLVFDAKRQLLEAVALNPDDADAHHWLGRLAWDVANWSWWYAAYLRTLVAEPPQETLATARDHFMRAESVAPRASKANMQRMAAVHHAMGLNDDACRWAFAVATEEGGVRGWDDIDAVQDALKLLRALDPTLHAQAAPEGDGTLVNELVKRSGLKPRYEALSPKEQQEIDAINKENAAEAGAIAAAHRNDSKPTSFSDIWQRVKHGVGDGAVDTTSLRVAGVAEGKDRR
jgi:hypothetical protein